MAKKKYFIVNKYYYNIGDIIKFNWLDQIKKGEIVEKQEHSQKGKTYKIKEFNQENTLYPYVANPEQDFSFGYVIELVESKKERKQKNQKKSSTKTNKKPKNKNASSS